MSDRQRGNQRENRVGAFLEVQGYWPFYSRGSRGTDIIALYLDGSEHGRNSLLIAVVRPTGPINENWTKLRESPRIIGSFCLVVREVKNNRFVWYGNEDHRGGGSFEEALCRAAEAW